MWLAEVITGAAGGDKLTPMIGVAATAAAGDLPGSTIIAGALALLSAAIAAYISSRGTLRTADVQREQNFGKRQDERNAYLEKRNQELELKVEEVTADRNRYRELFVQLRLDILERGWNPDNLDEEGPAGEAPR